MIKEIKMPKLGTTTDEIKIVRWVGKENDYVKRGDILFEVETDKSVMEVESYVAGYIKKIVADEGAVVRAGTVVAYVGGEDDEWDDTLLCGTEDRDPGEKVRQTVQPSASREHPVIAPLVKKTAERLGVDYTVLVGTGANGMITKEDVEKAATRGKEKGTVPFSRVEAATAKAMAASKANIPHVYFEMEVDASAMAEKREKSGKRISYNALLIEAVAQMIRKFPYLGAKYGEKGRVLPQKIDIGLAVARENDLYVPVIRNADSCGGPDVIEREIQDKIRKVSDQTIAPGEMGGAEFTITNLGGYGLRSFAAVINPPESAILAVGKIAERAVVIGHKIEVRKMVCLTLSVDHRVVNGAYAAEFLQGLKEYLERK